MGERKKGIGEEEREETLVKQISIVKVNVKLKKSLATWAYLPPA